MRNKRFRKTEDAILSVFFEEDNYISMGAVAKKIGVSRSTVYHHHRRLGEIIPDYERFMLGKYRRRARRLLRKEGVRLRTIYIDMLLFIMQYENRFQMMRKSGNRNILNKMITEVVPKLDGRMGLPKNSEKILRIYVSEIIEMIDYWGEGGFKDEEMEEVLSDIMYLTDTARQRLRPMLRQKSADY
ncbi:TetR/AcrR family transcriptional regulator [Candidatus Saccharibacteria bacterium]|nr:TetR/AcrR family transcriptional regulator [Candidatus Saccharibacteria bacterium]